MEIDNNKIIKENRIERQNNIEIKNKLSRQISIKTTIINIRIKIENSSDGERVANKIEN